MFLLFPRGLNADDRRVNRHERLGDNKDRKKKKQCCDKKCHFVVYSIDGVSDHSRRQTPCAMHCNRGLHNRSKFGKRSNFSIFRHFDFSQRFKHTNFHFNFHE